MPDTGADILKLIAAIMGVLGFLLSLWNAYRSVQSDQQKRIIDFARLQQEADETIFNGMEAHQALRNRVRDAQAELQIISTDTARKVDEEMERSLAELDGLIRKLTALKKDLSVSPPPKPTAKDIAIMTDKVVGEIKRCADVRIIQPTVDKTLQEAAIYIRMHKVKEEIMKEALAKRPTS